MAEETLIHFFDGKQIRYVWSEEDEKYYFSIVDVVSVLTEQPTPRAASTYWAVLKNRLKEEGADELLTNCKQLKLRACDSELNSKWGTICTSVEMLAPDGFWSTDYKD